MNLLGLMDRVHQQIVKDDRERRDGQVLSMIDDRITRNLLNEKDEAAAALRELREDLIAWGKRGRP